MPSLINDVSDHYPQFILNHNTELYPQTNHILTIRKIKSYSINEFNCRLSLETWEHIFNRNDVNNVFTAFLDRFLNTFIPLSPKR
jgi:hypothetical protein